MGKSGKDYIMLFPLACAAITFAVMNSEFTSSLALPLCPLAVFSWRSSICPSFPGILLPPGRVNIYRAVQRSVTLSAPLPAPAAELLALSLSRSPVSRNLSSIMGSVACGDCPATWRTTAHRSSTSCCRAAHQQPELFPSLSPCRTFSSFSSAFPRFYDEVRAIRTIHENYASERVKLMKQSITVDAAQQCAARHERPATRM